jgi:hypothetical protein
MASIIKQMGPRSKKEAKQWRKQEKKKLEAIEKAFELSSKNGQR